MSSFEAIERAIRYEAQRHMDALEFETEELVQETRRFDDVSGKTFAMRNKETEADYRYFPDPNLMPIIIDDEWMEQIKAAKPTAVDEKAEEYKAVGISDTEIDMLLSNQRISKMLDDVVAAGCNPKDAATWILTDCAGVLRKNGETLNDLKVTAAELAAVIKMVDEGKINRNAAKKILIAMVEQGVDPAEYCKELGLDRKVDNSAIESIIDQVISENPKAVEDFKNGKVKAKQALFGACMKVLKGAGDPAVIKDILDQKMDNL